MFSIFHRIPTFALLGFLAALLLWIGLEEIPLYILDEAKNAECAREMWQTNEWIVPTFNDELRMDKPPLHYFFMRIAYQLFDVSPFSARFFSAFMGLVTLGSVFFYTSKWLNEKAAIWSALSLLTSLHFLFQFHLAVPDPYLIACITSAIFGFHYGLEKQKNGHLFIAYTATALGTLAKGPVALGLVGLVMLLYLIFTKQLNWKSLKKLHIPLGAIWFLLLALPWYIAVGYATEGEWLRGFFLTHNMHRFTDSMEGHGGGFWLTWVYVIVGMLPFIVFLPSAIQSFLQERKAAANNTSFLLLCLIAAITIIGFFTISTTKLPNYTVPAYPFLAVLLGHYLSQNKRFPLASIIAVLITGLALPIGAYVGLKSYELTSDLSWVAVCFLPIAVGSILALFFQIKQQYKKVISSIAIGYISATLLLFSIALPKVFERNPVQQSLAIVEEAEQVVTYKLFNSAYLFNLERTFQNFDQPEQLTTYAKQYPDALILTQKRYLKDLPEDWVVLFEQQDLFEMQQSIVIKYKPQ